MDAVGRFLQGLETRNQGPVFKKYRELGVRDKLNSLGLPFQRLADNKIEMRHCKHLRFLLENLERIIAATGEATETGQTLTRHRNALLAHIERRADELLKEIFRSLEFVILYTGKSPSSNDVQNDEEWASEVQSIKERAGDEVTKLHQILERAEDLKVRHMRKI